MADWNRDPDRDFDSRYQRQRSGRDIPINNDSDYDDTELSDIRGRQSRFLNANPDYRTGRRDIENQRLSLPLDRSALNVQPVSPDPYITGGRRFYQNEDVTYSPDYLDRGRTQNMSPSQYRPGTYEPTGYDEEYRGRNNESNRIYERPDQDYGQLARYDRTLTNQVTSGTYGQNYRDRDRDRDRDNDRWQSQQSQLRVRDVMTRDVTSVSRATSIREAAELMKDEDVGSLPVVENNQVIGIVTDRDIVVRALAEGQGFDTKTVGDIMSSDLVVCHPTDRAVDVLRIMGQKQARRLPVVDNNNRLRG